MKLDITREEVREGKRDSPTECPFSLAIAKVLRRGVRARVYLHRVDFYGKRLHATSRLPEEAQEWLRDWDQGVKMQGIEVEMWVPMWALKGR